MILGILLKILIKDKYSIFYAFLNKIMMIMLENTKK